MGTTSYWVMGLNNGEPFYGHAYLFNIGNFWYSLTKCGLDIFPWRPEGDEALNTLPLVSVNADSQFTFDKETFVKFEEFHGKLLVIVERGTNMVVAWMKPATAFEDTTNIELLLDADSEKWARLMGLMASIHAIQVDPTIVDVNEFLVALQTIYEEDGAWTWSDWAEWIFAPASWEKLIYFLQKNQLYTNQITVEKRINPSDGEVVPFG